ncbi:MAG: hypothetical protein WBP41_15915 [Saprospiraceae bacterium]
MKAIKAIILILLITFPVVESYPSCSCRNIRETFLPYAKNGNGITAYIEVIRYSVFYPDSAKYEPFFIPFPIPYFQTKVIKNLSKTTIGDTINILVPSGVECCLSSPPFSKKGEQYLMHGFEWDESDYGYSQNEFQVYYLPVCMISTIKVENDFVIGPITKKKLQTMPLEKVLKKF